MFKQISIVIISLFFFASITMVSFAEYKKVKTTGSIEIETTFFRTATTEQKKKALEDARKKALNKYIAGLNSQRTRILNNLKDKLYKNIDVYVPEITTLNDGRWANGYWKIDVEASINAPQIEELVNKYIQNNIKGKGGVSLSFVFVAREVESVKKFTDKKTEKIRENNIYKENLEVEGQSDVTTTKKINQTENKNFNVTTKEKSKQKMENKPRFFGEGERKEKKKQIEVKSEGQKNENLRDQEKIAVDSHGNMSDKRTDIHEKITYGSVEKRNEVIKYRSYTLEEIRAKVTEVFNKADFEVVPTFEVGIDKGQFTKDFSTGNDLSAETKKEAVDSAKSEGINLLTVAMLDVGREQVDSATGLSKVYVNVMGYILDLRGKFSKRIASVGPVQYSGVGENPKVAKINALVNAGTSAAKDLVGQLRVEEGL